MQDRSSGASIRLTRDEREEFLTRGVLRIPGIIPKPAADAMAGRLWAELERRGIRRERPQTWTKERPAQFGELRKAGAFAEMASPALRALLDAFFAPAGWTPPRRWGQPLVTFPGGAASSTPGSAWHLDILPGQALTPWPDTVRVFTFLEPVEPGGGGTAYVAGAHRLTLEAMAAGRARSAEVRQALVAKSPWIAALCGGGGPPSDAAAVDGVELRLAEMTGAAGDVVLMHPAMLHAPAPNLKRTPRLMLVETIQAKI